MENMRIVEPAGAEAYDIVDNNAWEPFIICPHCSHVDIGYRVPPEIVSLQYICPKCEKPAEGNRQRIIIHIEHDSKQIWLGHEFLMQGTREQFAGAGLARPWV